MDLKSQGYWFESSRRSKTSAQGRIAHEALKITRRLPGGNSFAAIVRDAISPFESVGNLTVDNSPAEVVVLSHGYLGMPLWGARSRD